MININVRLANNNDALRIAELLYQVHDVHANIRPDIFEKGARKYNEEQVSKLINSIDNVIFVAEMDNQVQGYAICYKQYGYAKTLYIDDICVNKDYRRQHIGQALFKKTEEYAKENDVYNLVLRVWEGNDDAKEFYVSQGFNTLYTGMEKKLK